MRVKFSTSTTLVQESQCVKETFGLNDALRKLDKYELLILDNISYMKKMILKVKCCLNECALLPKKQYVNHVKSAFNEWDSIFGDNMMTLAAIDRMVHHCDIYQIQ